MGSTIENLLLYEVGEEREISDGEIERQVDALMQKIWLMGRRSSDL